MTPLETVPLQPPAPALSNFAVTIRILVPQEPDMQKALHRVYRALGAADLNVLPGSSIFVDLRRLDRPEQEDAQTEAPAMTGIHHTPTPQERPMSKGFVAVNGSKCRDTWVPDHSPALVDGEWMCWWCLTPMMRVRRSDR